MSFTIALRDNENDNALGVELGRDDVLKLVASITQRRDKALADSDFSCAVGFSHLIAMLNTCLGGGNQKDLEKTLTN